jgi:hypothetical protein
MIESITVITLLLSALDRIDLQAIFDRDPYESRRTALPGARLVEMLGDVAGARPSPGAEIGLLRSQTILIADRYA